MLQQSMALWIAQYGYPAIFFLLVGGIVGLPVPDQLLLVVSGYLVLAKCLALVPTVAAAILGSMVGITLSYILGRSTGFYVAKMRMAASRLESARYWFERFGGWTLVLGYFIPGIRNLIGFTSGAMKLRIGYFAPYAYAGAVISSVTCICAGYFLGTQAVWLLGSFGRIALIAATAASFFFIRRATRIGVPDTVRTTTSPTAISGILE
jgi:membrane protein DedA with SNARE-associated domain